MAKTATYSLINSTTLGSAESSVTFSSIPSTFTDLVLVCEFSLNVSNASLFIRLNSDTGSNYSNTVISGTGSAASSSRGTNSDQARITANATAQGSSTRQLALVNFMDYSNSNTYKTFLSRYTSAGGVESFVDLWRSTSAIASIQIKGSDGTAIIESGSTFKLYGIEAGNL